MPMKNPPHPGEIIRDLYIEPLELTVTHGRARRQPQDAVHAAQ